MDVAAGDTSPEGLMTPEKSFARVHEQQTVCANRLFSFLFETELPDGVPEKTRPTAR